jgi:hypothetical protein
MQPLSTPRSRLLPIVLWAIYSTVSCGHVDANNSISVTPSAVQEFKVSNEDETFSIKYYIENHSSTCWSVSIGAKSCKCVAATLDSAALDVNEKIAVELTVDVKRAGDSKGVVLIKLRPDAPSSSENISIPLRFLVHAVQANGVTVRPAEIARPDRTSGTQEVIFSCAVDLPEAPKSTLFVGPYGVLDESTIVPWREVATGTFSSIHSVKVPVQCWDADEAHIQVQIDCVAREGIIVKVPLN